VAASHDAAASTVWTLHIDQTEAAAVVAPRRGWNAAVEKVHRNTDAPFVDASDFEGRADAGEAAVGRRSFDEALHGREVVGADD
jgi:hypothetical protein